MTAASLAARARRLLRRNRQRGLVLVYHRVAHTSADPFGQAVTPDTFERQLEIAKRHGNIVSIAEMVERLRLGRPVDRAIAITFDDGYQDNLGVAAPIAARLAVPITLFVNVQPVMRNSPFWWDELAAALSGTGEPVDEVHRMLRCSTAERRAQLLAKFVAARQSHVPAEAGRPMSVSELREMALLPGVIIGAHTMTHPSLAALAPAEQLGEMRESRESLEQLLGMKVRFLAYPFGKREDVSPETQSLARAAGFDAAFTTMPMPVDHHVDLHAIPRLTMHEWTDDDFIAKLDDLIGPPRRARG